MAETAIIGHQSDTHQWVPTIGGFADMILLPSEYHMGPFDPGVSVEIASLFIRNDGNATDIPHIKWFEYPGGWTDPDGVYHDEAVLGDKLAPDWIDPGEVLPSYGISGIAPDTPGWNWPLGVKVWGEKTETEPPWGGLMAGMPSLSDAHRWSAGIGLPKPEEIPWWAYMLAGAGIATPAVIIVSDQLKK